MTPTMKIAMAAAIALLLFMLLQTWPAGAHEWYERDCCQMASPDGKTGHCAPIADEFVHERDGGYVVVVPPGGHPLLPNGGTYAFPEGDSRIRQSRDWRFHLCPFQGEKSATNAHCLYVRPGST